MVVIQCLTGFGQHVNGSTNQNDNVQGTSYLVRHKVHVYKDVSAI